VISLNYKRRKTNSVAVGRVSLGSDHPIRVQSMANTPTSDPEGSIEQCIRIADAGADYVRFTVPSLHDIRNIADIREGIRARGYETPIIADVHFSADIAINVTDCVDKVRINPGNFAGLRNYNDPGLSDEDFKQELIELKNRFIPLLTKCRHLGVALRIGVNHGSLSGRIMNRYGDTPEGMAESAMEFLRICKAEDFDQVVVSMKASNPRIMVNATRTVVQMMDREDMHYPVHLGVTEAGEGEDGRIKSAAGIGALLNDGIGDTIRISLTENPEIEIPVAMKLIRHISEVANHKPLQSIDALPANPFAYSRRLSSLKGNIGGQHVPVVISEYGNADYIYKSTIGKDEDPSDGKIYIIPYREWRSNQSPNVFPLLTAGDYPVGDSVMAAINFVLLGCDDLEHWIGDLNRPDFQVVIVYECSGKNVQAELRWLYRRLQVFQCNLPVIIRLRYREDDPENLLIKSASDVGGTFLDGFGDGLWIMNQGSIPASKISEVSFGILQNCRARITRTEYISCPSCGRTNFNLTDTLMRIRAATSHLKTLKIGVMGCIVNGPGEMADADYGYVGSGKGKITLYKAKQVIKKGIPEQLAVDELIALIRVSGDWTEP